MVVQLLRVLWMSKKETSMTSCHQPTGLEFTRLCPPSHLEMDDFGDKSRERWQTQQTAQHIVVAQTIQIISWRSQKVSKMLIR
jgi:hypothetical protein